MDLKSAVSNLTSAVYSPTSSPENTMQLIGEVAHAGNSADVAVLNEALANLESLISQANHPIIAATIGIACGALVESGGDPTIAFDPLLPIMRQSLDGAEEFGRILEEKRTQESENQAQMQILAREHPEAYTQYTVLERVYLPIIAMTSRSKDLRVKFKQETGFLANLEKLTGMTAGAEYLLMMWRVLDDEDIVVLHPAEKRGYKIRISGIADNFQLHVLLADAVIGDVQDGWIKGNKPAPEIAAAMRDTQPLQNLYIEGALNLVNYTGLQSDKTLGDSVSNTHHWIWNEGVPADIVPLNNQRIILLQDPPYVRSWNAQRLFDGMIGELTVEAKFDTKQVDEWLERIVKANTP